MRVLVVEDDRRLAELLHRAFLEDGYAVDMTGNGIDGWWLAQENPYDAIVLDWMLPDLDGLEVIRRLRAGGCWHPVIMLTARATFDARITGLDAGADDYLSKPFDIGELAARVRALVRRGGVPRPTLLTNNDLVLDPGARVVARNGSSIELTSKEFAILELLLRHVGTVVSRSQIVQHVWDFDGEPDSNVVDQYVAALRRKVDRPFGRADIETVRGAGYRLRQAVARS